jgi:outer membrane protein OmpA-like peptidoglycan-associated protein
MNRWTECCVLLLTVAGLAVPQAAALEMTLHQATFPERKGVDIDFVGTARAPDARVRGDVRYSEGQAEIEVKFDDMKPAILFGGDVTCYVLWAVGRDGSVENLGELWVRGSDDKIETATGMKSFAMVVTAEAYPLVSRPSELVVYTSLPPEKKKVPSVGFTFSGFDPAPAVAMDSIANIAWDSTKPLDLLQAEKAFELATREGAAEYVPQLYQEAKIALSQAQAYGTKTKKTKQIQDYSRRTVAAASEALQTTMRRKEREAIERDIEARRQEMEDLEARAAAAEEDAADAASALEGARKQQELADAAVAHAQQRLTELAEERAALEASVAGLSVTAERLAREKEGLTNRLSAALSQVADTQESARGFIINLPDILFDLNQATLKPEAKVVIAKLAGILLIMPELNLRVEGHTDATGGAEYNQELSERRAASVLEFISEQGIRTGRMQSVGYGEERPVADNETQEGRRKNRRVEIVISEGQVREATP